VPSAGVAGRCEGASADLVALAFVARTPAVGFVRLAEALRAPAARVVDSVRLFTGFAPDDRDDPARLCPGFPIFDEFLRDFLDIRLPFVAFAGSIIGVLKDLFGRLESIRRLGKTDGLGVCSQCYRRIPCSAVGRTAFRRRVGLRDHLKDWQRCLHWNAHTRSMGVSAQAVSLLTSAGTERQWQETGRPKA
jgi:hypothetical protein